MPKEAGVRQGVSKRIKQTMNSNKQTKMTSEERRLNESNDHKKHWKRWGPYLSERIDLRLFFWGI